MTSTTNAALLQTQWVTVPTPDGPMEAYMAHPQDASKTYPIVLVLMEIFGVNKHICSVTDRLAAHGYVALAPNYYHRSTQNLDLPYDDRGMLEGRRHKDLTTRQTLLADGQASLNYLNDLSITHPEGSPAGAVGFCYGGYGAYTLATLPQVTAAACFYPGGLGDVDNAESSIHWTKDIHGQVLCLFGEHDPLIPAAHTHAVEAELQRFNIPHDVVRYPNVGHGFFCDARADYNLEAANDAWQKLTQLFNAQLK
jgi:carboxymethylenebutenolidase